MASVNEVHKSNVGKAILSGNEVVVVRHKLVTVDNKKLKLNSLYCFCNWIVSSEVVGTHYYYRQLYYYIYIYSS